MDARTVQGHPTLERRVSNGLVTLDVQVGIYPADRCDHILSGPQDRYDLFVVGDQRAVHHAVRAEGQNLVGAGGGGDTQGSGAENLADVAAVLVRAVHPAADQLELWVIQHALDGGLADPTGRPLDDAKLGRITHW